MDSVVGQTQKQNSILNNISDTDGSSNDLANSQSNWQQFDDDEEIVIEINRDEMKAYYDETSLSDSNLWSQNKYPQITILAFYNTIQMFILHKTPFTMIRSVLMHKFTPILVLRADIESKRDPSFNK